MVENQVLCLKNIKKAQKHQKLNYDKNLSLVKNIEEGDLVLLRNSKNDSRMGGKNDAKWLGPFHSRNIKSSTLDLEGTNGKILHRNVAFDRVVRFNKNTEKKSEIIDADLNFINQLDQPEYEKTKGVQYKNKIKLAESPNPEPLPKKMKFRISSKAMDNSSDSDVMEDENLIKHKIKGNFKILNQGDLDLDSDLDVIEDPNLSMLKQQEDYDKIPDGYYPDYDYSSDLVLEDNENQDIKEESKYLFSDDTPDKFDAHPTSSNYFDEYTNENQDSLKNLPIACKKSYLELDDQEDQKKKTEKLPNNSQVLKVNSESDFGIDYTVDSPWIPNTNLTKEHENILLTNEWLDDVILNEGMALVAEFYKCQAPYYYLPQSASSCKKKREKNFFQHIHCPGHWILGFVNPVENVVKIYDSLGEFYSSEDEYKGGFQIMLKTKKME